MDLEGTLEGLYLIRVPKNLCCRVSFGVHLGSMKVQEGPKVHIIVHRLEWTNIAIIDDLPPPPHAFKIFLRGLEHMHRVTEY